MSDYEIDQIRKARHDVSAENGHDLLRVAEYYRRVEEELRESGHFRFFGDPPRSATSQNVSAEVT